METGLWIYFFAYNSPNNITEKFEPRNLSNSGTYSQSLPENKKDALASVLFVFN